VLLKLPRAEQINHFSITLNCDYSAARKVNLYFDDDPKPVALTTRPDRSRQEFDLAPRPASRLVIELADFDKPGKISGIDNIVLGVERSAAWRQKVKPLANVGGLVKYPMGPGGIVLNQVLVKPAEANPVNAQKKGNIVTALLRNLHATYAGSKVLTTANLTYQPLPLGEHCNQYLSKDRGWFDGPRDLSRLPVGANVLAGVPYLVRDFKTSPVPSCVMLAGPGAKGQLPKEVKGLPAGCKADVLFFLHAFNSRDPGRQADPRVPPPVAFRYVIHFADGQTAEIPVLLDEGVGHWISSKPAGLKSAALAWSARFPGDKSEEEAVVYQFAWTNPRANVAISSIDMAYGKDGDSYGTPVLLAVTAARAP
jgi:beta-galactosidase